MILLTYYIVYINCILFRITTIFPCFYIFIYFIQFIRALIYMYEHFMPCCHCCCFFLRYIIIEIYANIYSVHDIIRQTERLIS